MPAAELVVRWEAFLREFGASLAAMPEERFRDNVAAVVAQKLESPKNLREAADTLWGEVVTGSLDFRRATHEIAVLRALTLADLRAFFDAYVAVGGARRRAFVSLVEAGDAPAAAPAADGDDDDDDEEEGDDADDEGAAGKAAAAVAGAAAGAAAEGASPVAGETLGAEQTGSGVAREDHLTPTRNAAGEAEPATPAELRGPGAAPAAAAPVPPRVDVSVDLSAAQALAVLAALGAQDLAAWPRSRAAAIAATLACFEDAGVPVIAVVSAAAAAAAPGSAVLLRCRVAVPDCDALRGTLPLFPTTAAPATSGAAGKPT